MARRVVLVVCFLAALVAGPTAATAPVSAREPATRAGHMLGKAGTDATIAATLPSGFQDQALFSGLTHPTVIRFASDGRVFVAEKSGLIKVFDNLTDTTPTIFADLRSKVDDYWDRGLLGMALSPTFPTDPYVYVLYSYDAPIGGNAPVWNDACPTPPGPNTDGCVISGRLSRLQASGNVMTGTEQVLINDWCQQFPSHSIGTVAFGPDGALYVSGGDGASFNNADYGQFGGGAGSPTLKNPCGDPPNGVGGSETPPSAEGGALRSQDVRTLGGGGASYAATVTADSPVSWWHLGETTGTQAVDAAGANSGAYVGGVTLNQPGGVVGGDGAVLLDGTSGYVSVPDAASLNLGDGPFSLEAWINRPTLGPAVPGDQEQVFDKVNGAYQVNIQNNVIHFDQAGVGEIATSTTAMGTGWHHIVVTKNGAAVKIYQDGADTTGVVTNKTLTNGASPLVLGARRGGASAFLNGYLDEVAVYSSALSAARVSAHYAAGIGSPSTDPTSLDGAVLRLDPTTGAAMPGNPLGGSPDLNARKIVAHGFRNPFRFTFRPGTNEIWVGDVGWNTWEELDLVATPTAGVSNAGWPCYEGVGRQPGYDGLNLNLCETLYAAGSGAVLSPYYTYNHGSTLAGESCPTANGSSIAGLAFYQGGSYPTSYNGGLFFADYSRDCIWFAPAGANGRPNMASLTPFITSANNPVFLTTGPGGDLFYADFDGGTVRRITFTSGNQPPTAVPHATPTSGAAPLTVQFDGSASTDPEGGALTYAWDFDGNGTDDATGAQASNTYSTGGTFQARLRVTDPQGASDSKTVTITVNNTPPTPVIDAPDPSTTWAVGDRIDFSGHAGDTEDGSEPASRLNWNVILHHCPTDPNNCHTHPVQSFTGVASGTFSAPDHEYPSWLEIVLTATDSGGLQASTSIRLDPKTVDLSFATSPAGLQITAGSTTAAAPFTKTVILGSHTTINAISPQDLSGVRYGFVSWSDSGAQSHEVVATASATYTATFQATSADMAISQVATPTSGQVRLDLTVRNNGPVGASGVTARTTLNSKLTFVSATSTVGTCAYQSSTRVVTCTIGALASGGQAIVTIQTRNTQKGSITSTATVSATTADPVTANNTSSVTIKLR